MPRRMISQLIAGQSVVTASKATTVRAACELMASKKIGALLIVEGGRIAGTVIAAFLLQSKEFQADLAKAKAETRAALNLP